MSPITIRDQKSTVMLSHHNSCFVCYVSIRVYSDWALKSFGCPMAVRRGLTCSTGGRGVAPRRLATAVGGMLLARL
jgi:hypothetical protein